MNSRTHMTSVGTNPAWSELCISLHMPVVTHVCTWLCHSIRTATSHNCAVFCHKQRLLCWPVSCFCILVYLWLPRNSVESSWEKLIFARIAAKLHLRVSTTLASATDQVRAWFRLLVAFIFSHAPQRWNFLRHQNNLLINPEKQCFENGWQRRVSKFGACT